MITKSVVGRTFPYRWSNKWEDQGLAWLRLRRRARTSLAGRDQQGEGM